MILVYSPLSRAARRCMVISVQRGATAGEQGKSTETADRRGVPVWRAARELPHVEDTEYSVACKGWRGGNRGEGEPADER
jgi:hypothetical protein